MKTVAALLLSIGVVAGCATPNSLREGKPDLEATSTKSAKEVAMCIAEKWEVNALGSTPLSMRETPAGYMVTILCASNTCALADVHHTAAGQSRTKVYTNMLGAGAYINEAKACQ